MKITILILILFQSIWCYSDTFLNMEKVYRIDELIRFEYRAMTSYQILADEDFETIDAYYDLFFNLEIYDQTLDDKEKISILFFIKTLKIALIENKIPKSYLPKLIKFAVALKGFKSSQGYYLNTLELIWYLEYRNIQNSNKANIFLMKSLDKDSSSSNRKILKLLEVDSRYKQIEKWINKEEINNYSQFVSLLKRQYKITSEFKNNNKNAVDILVDDYRLTIDQVFSEFKSNETNYEALEALFKHNDWLFLQLHKYKENPLIKELLKKIYIDWLVFSNNSIINNLPIKNSMGSRYDIFKWINYKLNIFWKIQEIKKLVLKPSRHYQYEHERDVHEKNKNFIKQKLDLIEDNIKSEST